MGACHLADLPLPVSGAVFVVQVSMYKRKKRNAMTTNDFPPQLVLQQMIQGFQVTQCIYVAATLGIADLLKDGL